MMEWMRLAAVLGGAGLLLASVFTYFMARLLLRPPRMTDGKAAWVLKRVCPRDLGLFYQDLKFQVRDSATHQPIPIAAW